MKVLIIINDAPYGTEKAYNSLRLAMTVQKEHPDAGVRIFLMADSVGCALPDQATPTGYYNVERMLRSVISKGAEVKACGSCAESRGVANLKLIEGVELSTMSELASWFVESDKVVTF